MNNHKIIRASLFFFLIFLMSCGQSPTKSALLVEAATPDYRLTEISNYVTWKEELSLPNDWDGGLFSESPCQAPCFAGIIPGTTKESTVMNFGQENEYFQNCKLEDNFNERRRVSCKGMIIGIKDDGVVDDIGFSTSMVFTLNEIVSKFGEPTTVWVTPGGIPEAPEISMSVLLENEKIRLKLEDQMEGNKTYLLEPTAVITNIIYYSEINDGSSTLYTQPWHGYGEYIIDDHQH